MLVPRKPAAPPASRISYDERPSERQGRYDPEMDFTDEVRPEREIPAVQATPTEEPVPAVEEPKPQFNIVGVVVDAGSRRAVGNARVTVSRKQTPEDNVMLAALDERARRSRHTAMARKHQERVDARGSFTIGVSEPGIYEVVVHAPDYAPFTASTDMLGEDLPEFRIEARLHTGASISGRVVEAGGTKGAAGLTVRVESPEGPFGVTDSDGNYTVKGLVPGQFGVAVDLRGSPYMSGQNLPYQRVTITAPDQKLDKVDFVVDAAGIVWGYVMSPNQEPIDQTNVMLSSSQSIVAQAISSMAQKSAPVTDTSGADGYYELTGVPLNEEYRVHAMSSAYAPQLSESFLLTAGQRNVRIDIFMFAGTNVFGQVVGSDGRPVPSADVMCIPAYGRFFSSMTAPQAFRNTSSDKDGFFSIQELPAGEYQLFAQKQGYKISPMGFPIYPDGYSDLKNIKLTLSSVEEGSHAVFGRAVDDRGQGVDGVAIRLAGVSLGGLEGSDRSATTANNGQFRFEGVSAGQYTIVATKDGFSPTTVRRVRLNEETRVLMRQTAVVRGRVLIKGTSQPPEVYQVASYPLSESTGSVSVMGMMGDATKSEMFYAPDGSYELRINAGSHRLEASTAGYTPARIELSVEAGQVLEGIDFELDETGASISGEVFAADGASVQGATATLLEASSPAEALMMLASGAVPEDRIKRVGEDGAFMFDSLPPGEYVIIAQHPNYPNAQSDLLVLEAGETQGNVRIRFGAGGALEGYVYSEGQPVPEAVVLVVGNGITEHTNTDASGYYYLDGLASGVYQAMVTDVSAGDLSSIYDARGVQVTVEEGVITRYDFGTQEGARIEGSCIPGPMNLLGGRAVLQRPGFFQAALGETVEVTQLLGQSVGVNPGGMFLMEDVMPGEWQLDIYYFELGIGNPLEVRYVHSEFIQVEQGEVLPLMLTISY